MSHVAAQYGQTAFLYHVVLRWGAEVDPLDLDSRTPLHWAAYKASAPARQLSSAQLIPVLAQRLCAVICWLTQQQLQGYGDTVRLLLVMNARQDLADKEGCTPLHWGAIRGNGEACTLLLQVLSLLQLHRCAAQLAAAAPQLSGPHRCAVPEASCGAKIMCGLRYRWLTQCCVPAGRLRATAAST